jgi:hypothetical protein
LKARNRKIRVRVIHRRIGPGDKWNKKHKKSRNKFGYRRKGKRARKERDKNEIAGRKRDKCIRKKKKQGNK